MPDPASGSFRATVLVVTRLLDSPRSLTWEMVRELDRSRAIEIGIHTVHHVDLTRVSAAQVRGRMHRVRDNASRGTRSSGSRLCVIPLVTSISAGKQRPPWLVTAQPDRAGADDDPLALAHLRVAGGMTLEQFAALLTVSS